MCFQLSELWTLFYNSVGRRMVQFAGLWPNSNTLYMQYILDTEVLSTYPYPIHTFYISCLFLPLEMPAQQLMY